MQSISSARPQFLGKLGYPGSVGPEESCWAESRAREANGKAPEKKETPFGLPWAQWDGERGAACGGQTEKPANSWRDPKADVAELVGSISYTGSPEKSAEFGGVEAP